MPWRVSMSSSLSPRRNAASSAQLDFYQQLQALQIHFRGQLRAQLKPLAQAIGIGENTIRNCGNIIKINGREVRSTVINGRITFDLAEVAEALAARVPAAPMPVAMAVEKVMKGRPRKADLLTEVAA